MRPAFLLMIFLSLLQGALAFAALEGSPDPAPLLKHAPAPISRQDGGDPVYTVAQSKLDEGTVLRAYRDTDGRVFALSWSGPVLPDVQALLGEHFGSRAAGRAMAGQPRRADNRDVVIVSSGQRRAYNGRAWLPSALPAGFDSHSIE